MGCQIVWDVMPRLLITGGTGYLGGALLRQAQAAGHELVATYFSQEPSVREGVAWAPLDVRDQIAVEELLDRLRPDAVIHTAFRQAGPDLMAITARGAGNVARAAASTGARLLHVSSDVIFDGEREGVYTEADPPAPITEYGVAKAEAERLVAEACPTAAIVRTSLIYGFDPLDRGSQFVLDVAAGTRPDRLFTDELRSPVFVGDLAAGLLELVALPYAGVLHMGGAERVSRHELGCLIAIAYGFDPERLPAARSADSPVRRPRNCTLDSSRAAALLRTRLRGVREVLRDLGLPTV
jgi:dTDP-4-dehydrorhamnose reductase